MNTKILLERETERNLSDALARGALLWAPILSVGVSAIAYAGAVNPEQSASYRELLVHNLIIFSPICMLAESMGWAVFSKLNRLKRLGKRKEALPKLDHFVPPLERDKLHTKPA